MSETLKAPGRHGETLEERPAKVKEGKGEFLTLTQFKRRLASRRKSIAETAKTPSPNEPDSPPPADKGSGNPLPDDSGEHWRFCPRCGHELINEKCKLRCPRCHYFMSCSDFDFVG